jgi:23S rRNA (uracil747-C5)-methyltransferase
VECHYYDALVCRSCALLEHPYEEQLRTKVERARAAVADARWLEPVRSPESGFRTKAKMVAGGTVASPSLGILDASGRGVDLQECALYPDTLAQSFGPLASFVSLAGLEPYDVPGRTGELKSIVITVSPEAQLMVRFVLRSTEALARIRKHLPALQSALPQLAVASVNVLPEHKAVVEGEREIPLTAREELTMRVNGIPLALRPQSFFQTNTEVAAALYRQVAQWVADAQPGSVWDLYCGVGGFALHCIDATRDVVGVEYSGEAVASATATATALAGQGVPGAQRARFVQGDALEFALAAHAAPDLLIVNPPRRGIGEDLARWLEGSAVPRVVYSSCNVETLERDLAAMPSLRPVEARVLDMFPHTEHFEVAVLLARD